MILFKCFSILGFAIPIIFDIFITIDWIIYSIAAYVLQAFFTIAKMNFYSSSSDAIFGIMNRVMLLSGIYALFRLGFSLITYMMDPDKLEPSKAGGKIIRNAVIAVIFLAASTFIFKNLNEFSNLFVSNGVVEKIVYGPNGTVDNYEESTAAKAFVNKIFVELFKSDRFDEENASNVTKRVLESVENGESSITSLSSYAYTSDFQYLPFLTAIVGIMLIFYFCSFTIEIGTRIFKLFILQILSPIPAILSIDPTQNKKLTEYIKVYIGIYISLFIRLITVYLVFAMIPFIRQSLSDISTTATLQLKATFLVRILLYISAFHAAKELPKLIDDALGTKLGLGDAGKGFGVVLRGALAGTAGFTGGIVGGAISGGLGGAVGGGLSGAWTGATKGAAAKNAVETIGAGFGAITGSYGLGARVAATGGFGAFVLGGVENFFGARRKDEATVKDFENRIAAVDKDIEKVRKGINSKQQSISTSNAALDVRNQAENLRKNVDGLFARKSGLGTMDEFINKNKDYVAARELLASAHPNTSSADLEYLKQNMENAKLNAANYYNQERDNFYKNHFNGSETDTDLASAIEDYNAYCENNGLGDERLIKGYASGVGLTNATNASVEGINDADIKKIQEEIDGYQKDIAKAETEIEGYENKKEAIEARKDEYITKDKGYKRRDPQNRVEAKPSRSPRNLDKNDSNSSGSDNTE